MAKSEGKINKQIEFIHSLVQAGIISELQLQEVIKQHQESGNSLEDILVERGLAKLETIVYFRENEALFLPNNSKDSSLQDAQLKLKHHNVNINLSARVIFTILLKIITILLIAHLTTQIVQRIAPDFWLRDGLAQFFYFDAELNVPTTYSAFALLFASIILSIIAYIKKQDFDAYTLHWQGLSFIFLFLAMDELSSWHEQMVVFTRNLLNVRGFLYFAWVIPASVGVLIFLVLFFKFIVNLPKKTRNHFLIAGTTYISGCIGCELIGGYIFDNKGSYTSYLMAMTLEETLEMLGIAIFIYGLIYHISSYTKGATFNIQIHPKMSKVSKSPS